MNFKDIIDKGLEHLVNNPKYEKFPKSFLYNGFVEKEALLFIGINPSSEENQSDYGSYELSQSGNKHPYFKKFEDISQNCNLPWTHLDLLYFRETQQNTIHEILKQENGIEYIWKQLIISKKIIDNCNPQAIIVCNTLARRFMGKDKEGENNAWLNYEFVFDEEIGTYLLKEVPVFFSGMLTGQRALDIGSYERLKWQIKRALIIMTQRKLGEIESLKSKHVLEKQFETVARLRDTEKWYLEKLSKLKA